MPNHLFDRLSVSTVLFYKAALFVVYIRNLIYSLIGSLPTNIQHWA